MVPPDAVQLPPQELSEVEVVEDRVHVDVQVQDIGSIAVQALGVRRVGAGA